MNLSAGRRVIARLNLLETVNASEESEECSGFYRNILTILSITCKAEANRNVLSESDSCFPNAQSPVGPSDSLKPPSSQRMPAHTTPAQRSPFDKFVICKGAPESRLPANSGPCAFKGWHWHASRCHSRTHRIKVARKRLLGMGYYVRLTGGV